MLHRRPGVSVDVLDNAALTAAGAQSGPAAYHKALIASVDVDGFRVDTPMQAVWRAQRLVAGGWLSTEAPAPVRAKAQAAPPVATRDALVSGARSGSLRAPRAHPRCSRSARAVLQAQDWDAQGTA